MPFNPSIVRKVGRLIATQSFQWLSPEASLKRSRRERDRLVRHCWERNAMYRSLWQAEGIASLDDVLGDGAFERLPIVSKATLRSIPVRERISRGVDHGELVFHTTSGSTGQPFEFAYHRSMADHYAAREFRSMSMAGARPWSRIAFSRYHSIPFELQPGGGPKQSIFGLFELNRIDYDLAPAERIDALERVDPDIYASYPSYVLEIVRAVPRDRLRGLGLEAVMLFSEHTTRVQRRIISDAFGAPVHDTYSAEEFFSLAARCDHDRYHLSSDELWTEIVDDEGHPLPPGEVGRVVITPLHHRAMPLVRYALGDLGSLSNERCPCGRGLTVLRSLEGREQQSLVLPDGRRHPWIPMISDLNECDSFLSVEGIQVVQERPDSVKVLYTGEVNPVAEAELTACVRNRLGSLVQVRAQHVAKLARTKNGKLPAFISMGSAMTTSTQARDAS